MSRRSAELPDTTKPARGPWLKIVLIITALVVVVAGVATWYALRPATQSATEPTPTATSAPVGTGLANGCLAGPDRTAAALIAAQGKAPDTTLGAIELAAAYDRWATRFPFPSPAESKAVSDALAAKNAAPDMKDLTGDYAARPAGPANQVITVSTAEGKYFIESASEVQVVVTVGSKLIINGQPDKDGRASSNTVTLLWESGTWKIAKTAGTRSTEEIFSQGTSFAGGC